MGKSHGQGLKKRRENAFQTLHLPPFAQARTANGVVGNSQDGAKGCAQGGAGTGWLSCTLIVPHPPTTGTGEAVVDSSSATHAVGGVDGWP